jgi:hypothetical protein
MRSICGRASIMQKSKVSCTSVTSLLLAACVVTANGR